MDPVNNQMNHYNRAHMKNIEPTKSYRSLCECELYTSMYDDDPQMKEVMDNFNRQTQQRFHEYDERMVEKRMQCKDKCDKDIQKIILKDKLEKQMKQELTTLETKINTDDIPTCICEKSMVDKMEKNCMKCAQNLGGIVAPSSGVLAGIAEGALIVWKPGALDAAIAAALKDFIEQYLQNIQKDFILHDSVNEKPFITQIQDRFLDSSHEEVIYNIDWNVPENINRINNIMHDTKYCSNNLYTGTDLINDSLNGNQYIDIYDEMLKRKENELFGTYHTKYTTFNSVSKQTPSDPIINQLDLYHKWIDKHRDICEQWKTKEDMLYKSNEVWNMERKEYLLDIQPSTLDDIHKINDETYNIISTNNIYDHPSQETPPPTTWIKKYST
ncbi:erythrocyte membrane protein 1 [Plasmodium falciparum RAJ116]|uniref:Erythrocyte membrane protein 1 n=1 Tax=Plasmodium falciparum RAJ116 TaxID=580058 RepID=A0A0L0D0L5_PLAFA|nr:erythrocyte membrane protein 1 [Plasmodium falciparum RAJ116]